MVLTKANADDLLATLPLPLAQLYRRAQTSSRAEDRHLHAYYLAEATLKLAASARIGVILQAGVEPGSSLAVRLEKICMPTVGEWVGLLRDTSRELRARVDKGLLPLADSHDALSRSGAYPAIHAFAEEVSREDLETQPPLQRQFVNEQLKQGLLGFFAILASYRNRVLGHGAPRLAAYYERVGPRLMSAVCELLAQDCLFGELTLAVCRLSPDATGKGIEYEWRRLVSLGSLTMSRDEVGEEPHDFSSAKMAVPGQVYFIGPRLRIPLHPLVIYLEDRNDRERIGFLNDAVIKAEAGAAEGAVEVVRRCEYLDYASGDHLRDVDVRLELTRLIARLRGQAVHDTEIAKLATTSETEAPDTATIPGKGAVIGDFELQGELGRGAMGIVYRARQRSLNRQVAIKVLPPAYAADPVFLSRFNREIAALARCEHPNLVKIITSGQDGDRHYYAMELVEGIDLAELYGVLQTWRDRDRVTILAGHLLAGVAAGIAWSASRRSAVENSLALNSSVESPIPVPPPPATGNAGGSMASTDYATRLAELFSGAADGLGHLHARGIIHRDVKPGNMMLTADGSRLVIMDLGLAQVHDRSRGLTEFSTRWLGTLRYCSPEQLRWNLLDIDERADIYGMGAALHELLTLRPLFDGDSEARLIEQILHEEPREPRVIDPAVPRDFSAIISHCLDKDRTRRFASAEKLAEDLRRFVQGLPVSVRPLTKRQRLWRWSRNNPGLAGLTAAVATLLLVVSIGATVSAIVLANALRTTRLAEATAQTEASRAQREQLGREQVESQEDAAGFARLKEQIRAERLREAEQTLATAERRQANSRVLGDRREAWERLTQVVRFFGLSDATWNAWGEEDYPGVMRAAQGALAATKAFPSTEWWQHLPTTDLDPEEQTRFETEVYRVLMILSAVSTVGGSVEIEKLERGPSTDAADIAKRATMLFQGALEPLASAQAWEMAHQQSISISSDIMEQINRGMLRKLKQPHDELFHPGRQVVPSDADNYFLGLMFFVVQRASSTTNPLCPAPDEPPPGVADTASGIESPAAPAPEGMLSAFLNQELASRNIPRGATGLETSERLLRTAAGQERRYWPNFALGRTLFFQRKFSEAELAFGTCASLRPEYARSYEQRALMRALQATESLDPVHAETLRELARNDSSRALAYAIQAGDPTTWWPRADLHNLLGEIPAAIQSYLRALDGEDDVRQKVNRRNNLICVRRLIARVLADPQTSRELRVEASALSALADYLTRNPTEPTKELERAVDEILAKDSAQPEANLISGGLRLWRFDHPPTGATSVRSELDAALDHFNLAIAGRPDSFLAHQGRARCLDRLERWPESLAAWTHILEAPLGKTDGFPHLATTPARIEEAQQGITRARKGN